MFLLVEDAKKREREHLMTNGRSEKRKKKKQMTIQESMTPHKGKGKGPQTETVSLIETDNEQAVADHELRPTLAGPSKASEKSSAESSTLKSSATAAQSRPAGFYDTTSDEDEDEEENNTRIVGSSNKPQSSAMTSAPAKQVIGTKRKAPSQEDDFLDDLSTSGEEELVAAVERSGRMASSRSRHRDAFITPSAMRTTDMGNGMPTPSLTKGRTVKKVLFQDQQIDKGGEPSAKRRRPNGDATEAVSSSHTPAELFGTAATIDATVVAPPARLPTTTPTTATATATTTTTTVTTTTSSSPSPASSPTPQTPKAPANAGRATVTDEVMELLKGETISPEVRGKLRKTLEKHANLAKGYERGRDAARAAAKDAEDRVSSLQAKVADLEEARQKTRTQMMEMWSNA